MENKQSKQGSLLISLTVINILFKGPVYIKYLLTAATIVLLVRHIIEYTIQKKTKDNINLEIAEKK